MISYKFILRSVLVCATLALSCCATTPDDVNLHKCDIKISPVKGKHATYSLQVQRQYSEHNGNSKGETMIVVQAATGQGRKARRFGHMFGYGGKFSELGLMVSWLDDHRVKAEYDARFGVTVIDGVEYTEQTVRGSMDFQVEGGRFKINNPPVNTNK